MGYKFQKLEVWTLALEYTDHIYHLAEKLPASEEYNLKGQIKRAANSIWLGAPPALPHPSALGEPEEAKS